MKFLLRCLLFLQQVEESPNRASSNLEGKPGAASSALAEGVPLSNKDMEEQVRLCDQLTLFSFLRAGCVGRASALYSLRLGFDPIGITRKSFSARVERGER